MKEISTTGSFNNLKIFAEFNPDEIKIFEKHFALKVYQEDEVIKNDNGKELFIVLEGKIISSLNLPGSAEKKLVEYSAGDFFGEMSLFGYKSPFDTLQVQEQSKILSIHEKDLIEIMENNSNAAIKFISQIISLTIQKLRESSKFLADVVQWGENASRRVITDELTGVYNRMFLEDAIDNFFNISKSNNKPLSLLMIDIDNFRVINDTLGHEIGDKILQELVGIIREIISKHGIIARYGGDEFSVLLPETDLKKALEIAELIRKAVETFQFSKDIPVENIPVAASIGISSFPDTATDLNAFKEKADASLYKAKELGRNKVAYITLQ